IWIWLAQGCGAGTDTWGKLKAAGLSPFDVFAADKATLEPLIGRKTATIARLSQKDTTEAERIFAQCQALDITVLYDGHPEYPKSLYCLSNPPPVLYLKGKLMPSAWSDAVSIVGTRNVSDYGARMAYRIAAEIASAGGTVISGLALGTDAIAHAGALSAKGKTVAFLANGLDTISPTSHRVLGEAIEETGALVSEYSPGTPPSRYAFPLRNRLVAAVSAAVLVIEGKVKSGSLITGRLGMELKKPVYALLGRVDEENAEGPMKLLEEGARMLKDGQTVISQMPTLFSPPSPEALQDLPPLSEAMLRYEVETGKGHTPVKAKPTPKKEKLQEEKAQPSSFPSPEVLASLTEPMREVYFRIPAEGSCHVDELATDTLPSFRVMRILTLLEIAGLICRLPGGAVKRKSWTS
ncbi:MAG: DNA-processing protein DprA, partial [Clostridia bacterium]|nr:DNA-processing protein DprA [Clostridia bacterium]